jgi:glycosyltransferase involved in cell wall biosynthesis
MISTIIPVHNTNPEWLVVAVQSIRNQSFKDIEIILIDDASTDERTIEELRKMNGTDRTTVITLEKNLGISGALNVGLNAAKYDIVARMDSDDYCVPDRFKKQIDYLQNNPEVDMVGTDLAYLVLHEGKWQIANQRTNHPSVITREIAKNSLWFVNHPTVMFRKSAILELGGYDISLRGLAEDYELWIRMIRKGKVIHNINDVDLFLRINPNSLVQNIKNENHEFQLKLQQTL